MDVLAREFSKSDADRERIAVCGEQLILQLYKCGAETLDKLRFYQFNEKNRDTRKKNKMLAGFSLAALAPTSASARQHSFRAYLPVQNWLGNDLCPTDWGGRRKRHASPRLFIPIPMAPEDLEEMASSKCNKGQCRENTACSCRKAKVCRAGVQQLS